MKYIDADLLRKEIEFAKSVYDNPNRVVHGVADAFRQDGRAAMCDDILKKIDSLQQEQPDVDLEQNIEMEWDSFNKHLAKYDEESEEVVWLNRFSFVDIVNYFYELGLKAKK